MASLSIWAIVAIVILCIGAFLFIFIAPCITCKNSNRTSWKKRREIEKRNQIDEIQRPSSSNSSHSSTDSVQMYGQAEFRDFLNLVTISWEPIMEDSFLTFDWYYLVETGQNYLITGVKIAELNLCIEMLLKIMVSKALMIYDSWTMKHERLHRNYPIKAILRSFTVF